MTDTQIRNIHKIAEGFAQLRHANAEIPNKDYLPHLYIHPMDGRHVRIDLGSYFTRRTEYYRTIFRDQREKLGVIGQVWGAVVVLSAQVERGSIAVSILNPIRFEASCPSVTDPMIAKTSTLNRRLDTTDWGIKRQY